MTAVSHVHGFDWGKVYYAGIAIGYDHGYAAYRADEAEKRFNKRKEKTVTTVDSTSDERTVNNVMRHNYRVLSDQEKTHMQHIKDQGLYFVQVLHGIGGTDQDGERQASRELSLAQTKIEEAVMWAVKHITR